MDVSRNDMLGALARDAELERNDFLVQATEQLRRFLDANGERITALGGLTLIDDDPDYLAIAQDLTFRSRSRFEDPDTGEWVSETEIIETPSELVELYNPADVYQWVVEASREAAGLDAEPTAAEDLLETAGIPAEDAIGLDEGALYAGAADEWAAGQPEVAEADDEESAARSLYDLALEFQERSQHSEARLLEQFEEAAARLTQRIGDLLVVDDDDERLVLGQDGHFRAEVLPEDADGEWRGLADPDELVEYYDPTDVFGDLADALAEAYPSVAPETEDDDEDDDEDADEDAEEEGGAEDVEDVEDKTADEARDAGNGQRP
jgi:hypothetical protein